MSIFKVLLKTTNGLKDTAKDKKYGNYIDVENGFIYVTEKDLQYVIKNFDFEVVERVGLIYQQPCRMEGD